MSASPIRATPPRPSALAGSPTLKFFAIGRSDVGCVRKLNEDAFLDRSDIGLWAVADGMGGHEAGEIASRLIVQALSEVSRFSSAYAFRDDVCRALRAVNAQLVEMSQSAGRGTIGSTVVALLAHGVHFACVWAGDSRAYLYRDGVLRPLTRDHSFVQGLIDRGQLTPEQGRGHAAAHVITRAVGADRVLELDTAHGEARAGDRFVLCSDGLSGVLSDKELADFLTVAPLEAALDRMISCALGRGAPDNVTAVLVGAEGRSFTG